MMKLLKHDLKKATKYIKSNAYRINLAWYAYNFEGI